ncbi:hypothetical protein AALO_G00240300 [Alosa alosa]|uniref:C2 domain-containing protein n=1 Tax=Alosa alosa TaxID=278164 RepID=A0AAV6FQY6_9TELE|nr:hypothetical protein AALO_G00240300 [Alosa alosa]
MGVLRVHFLEAQDLVGKDKFLGGLIKGKSDPYGVIQVANQLFQSRVIKENVNPRWNEVYEALVYDHPGQSLDIELFDEDTDKDDFLGSLTIDVAELEKQQRVDEWFQLEEVASGKLHLKLEWLSLLPAPDKLDQVLSGIKAEKGQADDGLSSALLLVHLDSAKHLPGVFEGTVGVGCLKERRSAGLVFCENTSSLYRSLFRNPLEFNHAGLKKTSVNKALKSGKKVTSDPSPFVQFTVGHKSYESKTRYKTNEPVWEEAFTFLIHNPKTQQLEVEVKDEKHECTLGTLSLPVSQLLDADQMTLNQRFPLNQSGPSATLKMKMALRVLRVEKLDVSNQPSSVQIHNFNKEPTPSIASDISAPYATQELQHRLEQLHNGSPSSFPLGEVQLTVRHSSQRNKLIVVVHACRNLIAFTDSGSDPYVRLYLLPDKRRSGRRKTHTFKKTLNPVYDQTFEFSVSIVELHRRTLDVAVKNGGGILSKHKGLLGKVLVDLSHEVISKGWTQWYELSEDGLRKPSQL